MILHALERLLTPAPAPIENILNAHPMIEQTMVSGAGQPTPFAMVLLAESLRPKQDDPATRIEIERQLASLLDDVNGQVTGYAQLKMIVVERDPWSIENGCLTPTMKIKRAKVEARIAPRIAAWYAEAKKVLWT